MEEQIRNNIRYLCKLNNIRLGSAERSAGVPVGYLSRTNNRMKVDTLIRFAENLNVTVNDLVYRNYEADLIDVEIREAEENLERLRNKKQALKQMGE